MAANCYRTIKIHFKRGEPDIGKKQNDIVADTCFQPWLCRLYGEKSGGRTGRTCKKGETVGAIRQSFSLLRYKTLRLNNCASHSRYFSDELGALFFE